MAGEMIVGLDGSEKEARALPVAAALAAVADSSVHLVRVIRAPSDRIAAQAELLGVDHAAMTDRPEAERRVLEQARRLQAEIGREVTWNVVDGVDIAETLIRYVSSRDALGIVLGTRAASATGLALVGSVADRVMRECPRPVVLVPPGASYLRGKQVEIGRVLVPLDGSTLALRSLDYLLALPNATRVEYVLLEVVPARGGEQRQTVRVAAAEDRLQIAAAHTRARGVAAVEAQVLDGDDAAKTIAAAVRECLVELIAMSTRGTGGLKRFVLGSVAEGVVRSAEVPVLLLTPAMLARSDIPAADHMR